MNDVYAFLFYGVLVSFVRFWGVWVQGFEFRVEGVGGGIYRASSATSGTVATMSCQRFWNSGLGFRV